MKEYNPHPRSAPSATCVAAHKSFSSPEAEEVANKQSLSGIPSRPTGTGALSGKLALSGLPPVTLSKPTSSEELPDLVVNRNTENTEVEAENANVVNPVSTEEELEAADILLSLGEVRFLLKTLYFHILITVITLYIGQNCLFSLCVLSE